MEPQAGKLAESGGNAAFHAAHVSSAPALRVLIDARKLGDGGIGVYTENLIAGLLEQAGVGVSIISTAERASRYAWRDQVELLEDSAKPYSLDEMFGLARRVPFSEYDVFHVPHYTLPFGVNIPTVITLHDLIQVYHPEKRYYPIVAGSLIRSGVSRATRVIAVSNATFEDLGRFNGGRDALVDKVRVIPNALDPCFLPNTHKPEQLTNRCHIRGKYLLAVCSMLKPHKGLRDLLSAFAALRQHAADKSSSDALHKNAADLKLVLVGQGIERMVETTQLLEEAGAVKGVHILGSVTKQELASLYAGALALVVPSKAEGFCIPAIEAQAMGTPVIARPVPAILELLGENDLACADFTVEALRDGIIRFLERPQTDAAAPCARSASPERMMRYSREDIARTVLQVYREAVTDFGRRN